MEEGMNVQIGDKYASICAYRSVIGLQGVVQKITTVQDPYGLYGRHKICRVKVGRDKEWKASLWEIHEEDCIPLGNKEQKHLLARLDD